MQSLTFEEPDTKRFPCLALAYEALRQGGNMPCIVNAANEIVNRAFIEDKIPYTRISEIIEKTMQNVAFNTEDTLDNYLATDKEARAFAASLL